MPDRFSIDKKNINLYEEIMNDPLFKGKENKELFILAAVYGYYNNKRNPLSQKHGFVRSEYLSKDDWAIVKSITIQDIGLKSLEEDDEVYKIIEEYANGGIQLINLWINNTQLGIFELKFEEKVTSLVENIVNNNE